MEESGFLCIRPNDGDDSDVDDYRSSFMLLRGISHKNLEVTGFHEVSEFFLVDLNKCYNGKLLKPLCDTLITTGYIGSITPCASHAYVSSLRVRQDPITNDIDNYHHLTGMSCIDLIDRNQPSKWHVASPPTDVYNFPLFSATLNGIIHCLPSQALYKAQSYDPFWGGWFNALYPPPDNISKCLISGKLIPDPPYNRILVHLSEGDLPEPSLYAWYPQGRRDCDGPTWDFLTLFSTRSWRKKPVLVRDILFLYFRKTRQLFRAFDLKRKRFLDIEWDQYYPAALSNVKARSMFHTGGTQLTLGTYSRFVSDIDHTHTGSSVYFIRYHFKRVSEDTIVFSYDLTKHFKLLNIKQVTDFICLDSEVTITDESESPLAVKSENLSEEFRLEEQSNGSVSREFQILVCGVQPMIDGVTIPEDSEYFERCEFYKVSQLGVEPGFLDPLFSCSDVGTIVREASRIYFFGSVFGVNYSIPASLTVNSTGENIDCLKGVAWVDLSDKHNPKKWFSGHPPPSHDLVANFTVFNGMIFSISSLEHMYVYLPYYDVWDRVFPTTPRRLTSWRVAGKLIPDRDNGRILFHLVSGDVPPCASLYAWYPDSNWVVMEANVDDCMWKKKCTLADGLLFYYYRGTEELFRAFDLSRQTWATIEWIDRYPFFLTQRVKARSMFYLGNYHICLAFSKLILPPKDFGSKITFLIFRFECKRSLECPRQGPTITMSYVTTKTIFIKGLLKPVEFIPLSDDK